MPLNRNQLEQLNILDGLALTIEKYPTFAYEPTIKAAAANVVHEIEIYLDTQDESRLTNIRKRVATLVDLLEKYLTFVETPDKLIDRNPNLAKKRALIIAFVKEALDQLNAVVDNLWPRLWDMKANTDNRMWMYETQAALTRGDCEAAKKALKSAPPEARKTADYDYLADAIWRICGEFED